MSQHLRVVKTFYSCRFHGPSRPDVHSGSWRGSWFLSQQAVTKHEGRSEGGRWGVSHGAGPAEERRGLPSEPRCFSGDSAALGTCSQSVNSVDCFSFHPHLSHGSRLDCTPSRPLVYSVRAAQGARPRNQKQAQHVAFPPASGCPAEAISSLSLSFLTCQMDITFARLREATAGVLRKAWSSLVSFSWDRKGGLFYGLPATADARGDCPPFSRVSYSLCPGPACGQGKAPE